MPLTIYRRKGSNIWHYRGTVDGQRLRKSTRTTDKATAQRIAAEREAREWKGRLDGPAAILTFAQATALYQAAGKPTRFILKVLDYWKDTPVKSITSKAIKESCSRLYPKAGNATWNRQVIVPTQAIINHASEAELCPPIRVKRWKVVRKEKEPSTWTWVTKFQSASSPHLGALAMFMFLTGARISEALSVTWADLNLGSRTGLITQGKQGGDERVANLPPELVVALANIEGREGRVFKFGSRHNLKTQWELAIKKAGIKRLTPHSCRHGFATAGLQAGIDPVTLAKLGGWKDTAMLFKTYGHALNDPRLTDRLTGNFLTQPARKYK